MPNRQNTIFAALIGAFCIVAAPASAQTPASQGPERFAAEIAAFQAADRAAPPPACQVVFTGSSTIRRWTSLTQDMAPLPVLNRGFGGSQIADVDYYFDQDIAAYKPRAIVFYAGDNDIAANKTPTQVYRDFRRFMQLKDYRLGHATPVYFISIKPSKLRFDQMKLQAEANAKVLALSHRRRDLHYIDVAPDMLEGGQPKDIFVKDGLHMTPAGYEIWTKIVRPALSDVSNRQCS